MEVNVYDIITKTCEALNLDPIKFVIGGVTKDLKTERLVYSPQINKEYRDGRTIAIYFMRDRVYETRRILGSKPNGQRMWYHEDMPITYKKIAEIFHRKQHGTIMSAELECKQLIKTDKNFKRKFDMVVNLLDNNVDIA